MKYSSAHKIALKKEYSGSGWDVIWDIAWRTLPISYLHCGRSFNFFISFPLVSMLAFTRHLSNSSLFFCRLEIETKTKANKAAALADVLDTICSGKIHTMTTEFHPLYLLRRFLCALLKIFGTAVLLRNLNGPPYLGVWGYLYYKFFFDFCLWQVIQKGLFKKYVTQDRGRRGSWKKCQKVIQVYHLFRRGSKKVMQLTRNIFALIFSATQLSLLCIWGSKWTITKTHPRRSRCTWYIARFKAF